MGFNRDLLGFNRGLMGLKRGLMGFNRMFDYCQINNTVFNRDLNPQTSSKYGEDDISWLRSLVA